jgi:hypothetical protein
LAAPAESPQPVRAQKAASAARSANARCAGCRTGAQRSGCDDPITSKQRRNPVGHWLDAEYDIAASEYEIAISVLPAARWRFQILAALRVSGYAPHQLRQRAPSNASRAACRCDCTVDAFVAVSTKLLKVLA